MSTIGLSVNKIRQNPQEHLHSVFKTEAPKSLPKLNIPQWYEAKAWIPQSIQDFSKKLLLSRESNNYKGEIKETINSFEETQKVAHNTLLASPILAGAIAAIPFLPTLPILVIGGLVGAGAYVTKKIYDQKKLAYLGQEYDRRVEALEADPIAKSITEEALEAPKETSFSDITTLIKNYNKNNDIAQKKYKKDMLDVFIPYKKQEDSRFYEKNLGGRPETFYNDVIPKTADSDVTSKHFSWLANNGAIVTPPTPFNPDQDLNGMPASNTGVRIDDDKSNLKTAFMIKVMKKYGLDIKNADTIENFHKIELNKLNYKRALRLFKADNCPAKEQFAKIRNIIKNKYAEFNKEDASLNEKEEYFIKNIANVITKEAKNHISNPEFMKTLTALLVAEWYNIKRQHTST